MKHQAAVLMASVLLISAPAFAQGTDTTQPVPGRDAPAATESASPSAPNTTVGTTTILAPEGYTLRSEVAAFTTAEVEGMTLNGPDGAQLGEIRDVEMGTDGTYTGLIADVGGILNTGEHRVLLNPEQVSVFTNANGDMVAVSYLSVEDLRQLPGYTPPEK